MPMGMMFGDLSRWADEPRPPKVGRPKRDRKKAKRRRSGR